MPSAVDRSSGYVLEWDLRTIDLSKTDIFSPRFSFNGIKWRINIHRSPTNISLGVYLNTFPQYSRSGSFPGSNFRLDLVKRLENQTVKSGEWSSSIFYYGRGFSNWVDPGTIRDHILKVEMWIGECFSDFVEKPSTFHDHRYILFVKERSDFSFKVGDEVIYVVRDILTSRSDYFRAMLLGYFKEARVPVTVDAQIPIHEISSDVFEMIVEWLYTMDICQLNGLSPYSLHLEDLERVYVAADMLLITDLCDSIERFLMYLVNDRNFGDIYQVSKRIGNTTLEQAIFQIWISNSESFNKNSEQINLFLHEYQDDHALSSKKEDIRESMGSAVKSSLILGISRKIMQTSSWTADNECSLSVIKYLTSSLSLAAGVNMDKGIPIHLSNLNLENPVSGYDFEFDLKDIALTKSKVILPRFFSNGFGFYVYLLFVISGRFPGNIA
jgi:hypothetical protein